MEAVGRSCSPSLSFFLSPYLQPDFNLSKLHHGEKLSQSAVANSSPFAAPNRPLKPCNQLASRYLLRDSGSYFEPLPAPLSLSLSSKEQLEEQRFSTRENGGPIPVSGEALNRANRRERERVFIGWTIFERRFWVIWKPRESAHEGEGDASRPWMQSCAMAK